MSDKNNPFEEFVNDLPEQPEINCPNVHPVVQDAADEWDDIIEDDFAGPDEMIEYLLARGMVTKLQMQIIGCTLGALDTEFALEFLLALASGNGITGETVEKVMIKTMSVAFTAQNRWNEQHGE